ncbi:MAG TPA: hypothetical protein PKD54_08290, partial [Pirellulaceae bacterium]|nr:hypothetical protein [Pirellulaceae bacterium]
SQRGAGWEQSRSVADDFLAARPDHPQALLARVQQGLSLVAEGRLLAQELAVRNGDESLRDAATVCLRSARSLLDQLQREVAKQIPQAPRTRSPDGRLTGDEWRALANNLRFQVAQCHVLRAELADADEVTRLDSLHVALEQLDDILRQVDPANALWTSTQLLRITALRMSGNLDKAIELFQQLDTAQLPPASTIDYWTERLDLGGAGFEPDAALDWWRREVQRGSHHPRIAVAALRLILAEASRRQFEKRDALLAEASELTRLIETRHGPYWGRLAENHLVSGAARQNTARNDNSSTPIEILIRVGDSAARDKRYEDALTAYQQAMQQLDLTGSDRAAWQVAFTLALKQSALLEQNGEFQRAARDLEHLVARQPDHDLADTVHLRAAWCVAQALQQHPELQPEYRRLLTEHVDRWPRRTSSDQARIWLARLQLNETVTAQVVEWLIDVSPSSPHAENAYRELALAAPAYLELVAAKNPAVLGPETQRLLDLLQRLFSLSQGSGQTLSASNWQLAIAIGRVTIRFRPDGWSDHVKWLDAMLGIVPAIDQPLVLAVAKAQRVALRAAVGQLPEIYLSDMDEIRRFPQAIQECLLSLEAIAAQPGADPFVELRLQLLDELLSQTSGDQARLPLWLKQTRLWRQQGRISVAAEHLKELIHRFPRRLDLQRELGLTWMDSETHYTEALAQWRQIAAATPEHSEPWYEAKYYVAWLLLETGQRNQALQMLEYLKAVPPGWHNSSRREDFERLLARCRQ